MSGASRSEWVAEIPGKRPPRPGEVHWSALQRAKKQWAEYFGWLMLRDRIVPVKQGERFRVEIVFYRPGPVGDKDNDHAACKVILDAMKRAGLIWDDGPHHIDLEAWSVSARPSRVVVRRIATH